VGDVAVVVDVVLAGVVVLVAVVVCEAVVAGVPAAWVGVEVEVDVEELPHPARSTSSDSRTRRFMGRGLVGTAHRPCHYPDAHGP
jgi:hypothetical protein